MQRVRVGLTGLAGVFILVLVAAAFFGLVRREPDARSANAAAPVAVETPKEPLAELGVTPGNLPETPPPAGNAAVPAPAAR